MEREVKCPWCGGSVVPRVSILHKEHGKVKERRCTKCGKVLAAYLESEGKFLKEIRTF